MVTGKRVMMMLHCTARRLHSAGGLFVGTHSKDREGTNEPEPEPVLGFLLLAPIQGSPPLLASIRQPPSPSRPCSPCPLPCTHTTHAPRKALKTATCQCPPRRPACNRSTAPCGVAIEIPHHHPPFALLMVAAAAARKTLFQRLSSGTRPAIDSFCSCLPCQSQGDADADADALPSIRAYTTGLFWIVACGLPVFFH